MKKILFFMGVALFSSVSVVHGMPNAMAVIVSSKSPITSVNNSDVRNIFKGDQTTWPNGDKIVVIDYTATSPARANFYQKVLHASPSQKFYPGRGPVAFRPIEQGTSAAVKRFVASVPNAIGYISATDLDETVKEVLRVE